MTDALLFHTPDGGDIQLANGQITTSNGLYTALYLALVGGNDEDSGDDAEDSQQWWGNLIESDPARHYRSRTQYVLQGLPATTGNLRLLSEAVDADLQTLVDDGTITEFSALVRLTAPRRVSIGAQVVANGELYQFEYEEAWETAGG